MTGFRLVSSLTVIAWTLTAIAPAPAERWVSLQPEGQTQGALYLDVDSIVLQPNGWRQFWLKSAPGRDPRKKKDLRMERRERRGEGSVSLAAPMDGVRKPATVKAVFGEVRLRHALDCQTRAVIPPLEIVQRRGRGKPEERIRQNAEKVMTSRRDVLTMPAGDKVFAAVCGDAAGSEASQTPLSSPLSAPQTSPTSQP